MVDTNLVRDDCESGRLRVQSAAAELYQLAALLVGEERQAAALVETAVARTEADPCADAEASVQAARVSLIEAAVAGFRRTDSGAFDPPPTGSGTGGCIEGDDVSATGLGSEPQALRDGLNKLSPVQRMAFVMRAILGWDSETSAALLERAGCPGWGPAQVGEVFRQALCSVSTSLVEANG